MRMQKIIFRDNKTVIKVLAKKNGTRKITGIPQLLQFADGNTRFCGNKNIKSNNLGRLPNV